MKYSLAQRYAKAYDHIGMIIYTLEQGIQESEEYRQELNDAYEDTGKRCSDAESQQVGMNSAWDDVAKEEITFLQELVKTKPANLITQIRQRMKYLNRELRELKDEESEGGWSDAWAAGREQALEEQYDRLLTAVEVPSQEGGVTT